MLTADGDGREKEAGETWGYEGNRERVAWSRAVQDVDGLTQVLQRAVMMCSRSRISAKSSAAGVSGVPCCRGEAARREGC